MLVFMNTLFTIYYLFLVYKMEIRISSTTPHNYSGKPVYFTKNDI